MIALDDCQSYLQEICHRYEQWWAENALTEAIAARQATFSFEQMVQTEEKDAEGKPKKIPPLPMFEAIENYIQSEHILLVGSPGVGKSTALLRCWVQLAEKERDKTEPRIPVLISLKRYNSNRFSCPEDPSGILTLIKDTLEPDLWLKVSDINKLLFKDKRLILLLDGLNEMSAGEKRTELEEFRKKCDRSKVPLICTTRELGGGDLGIKRRLEIQPLKSEEVERFLQNCLPNQKQKILQLLNRDNRELSRTPFVLWMLYDLFQKQGTEVETLAEAFRQFFQSFKKYKEDAPVIDERRQQWNRWIEHLAFTMLNNPDPTDPGLVISKEQAEKILIEKFDNLYGASSCIEELLKYHLLEPISEEEISFHHQLIQEYYAAECLLTQLPNLLKKQPEQKYTPFQMNYLNYVKWTEAIALMLGFPKIQERVEQLVNSAMSVDLYLAGKLAGAVKFELQDRIISSIVDCETPQRVKIEILGITKSEIAIPKLLEIAQTSDIELRQAVIDSLGSIPSERSNAEIIKALDDPNPEIRQVAVYRLGVTRDKRAVPYLCKALSDSIAIVCEIAADALSEINSSESIYCLVQRLNFLDRKLHQHLAELLPNIGQYTSYEEIKNLESFPEILFEILNNPVCQVRQAVIEAIYNASSGKVADIFKEEQYELSPYGELIELARHEAGCPTLLKASTILKNLENENYIEDDFFIEDAPEQVNSNIELSELLSQLQEALAEQDVVMISATTYALGKEGCGKLLELLINALDGSTDIEISWAIADAIVRADECSILERLWEIHLDKPNHRIHFAIATIQSRCGFYNYEIYQYAQNVNKLENSSDFISQLYKDLDRVIYEIEKNPEVRQKDGEDRLTIEIVGSLRSSGYSANHDCKIGGHADITVEKNDFIWLGEAKIYKDNNYLWEGFLQLTTRYSIGNKNQSSGGLLIYIFDEDAKSVMEKWQTYLSNKNLSNYNYRPCELNSCAFISSHKHQRSGLPFHVRHIPVLLHFSPQDKSGRQSGSTK